MPVERIETLRDSRLDVYRDVRQANLTRYSGRFITEGRLVTERLLTSDYEVESVLVDDRSAANLLPLIPAGTTVYQIPHELVDDLVGFHFHRGVMACGRRRPFAPLESVAAVWPARATIVVACGVMDPENLGSIIRSSAAFGADALLLGPSCADPFSRRVLRVSMAAALRLTMIESLDLVADLQLLRRQWQVRFAATVLSDSATPLEQATRGERFGLVFGSEGYGLPAEVASACDDQVTLPMRLETDSLNVSVATGVFLYHFTHVAVTNNKTAAGN
ncbi:MAG: RNA methyltransferase [Planctomycetales bacterium]|nr:RNA methyltransferase [Planctomycetales bacterium]